MGAIFSEIACQIIVGMPQNKYLEMHRNTLVQRNRLSLSFRQLLFDMLYTQLINSLTTQEIGRIDDDHLFLSIVWSNGQSTIDLIFLWWVIAILL